MGLSNDDESNFDSYYQKLTRQIKFINYIAVFTIICKLFFEICYVFGDNQPFWNWQVLDYRLLNCIEIIVIACLHATAGTLISISLKK